MIGSLFTIDDPRIEPCPTTGCWLWVLLSESKGYSKTTVPRTGRRGMTHRLTWEVVHGPIPEGMQIDHVCRNRACCNPDHLRVVTPRDNALFNNEGPAARRYAQTECSKCNAPFTHVNRKGHRMCRTCEREKSRKYEASGKRSRP